MSSVYVRPKFTDGEARALLTIGQNVMKDEELAERVFSNGVDTSAYFRALGKLVDGITREKPDKADSKKKKGGK